MGHEPETTKTNRKKKKKVGNISSLLSVRTVNPSQDTAGKFGQNGTVPRLDRKMTKRYREVLSESSYRHAWRR